MFLLPHPQKFIIYEEKFSVDSLLINTDDKSILSFIGEKGSFPAKFTKNDKMRPEEYKITASPNGINITYADLEAAYRAYTTIKQLFAQADENGEINCFEIEDYPSVKNRGYMLDISRGRIPKLSHLKNLVDMMADLKYNQLQLYVESFAVEYKNFPDFCKDTMPLTREEIIELDKYCAKHFIELVPNQNSLGHMGHWTGRWSEHKNYTHLAITDEDGTISATLNPLLPESLELVDKIYDGYIDIFSSDKVHIGLDEPSALGKNETKEACDKYGVGKIYTDYLQKVCALASDKYKKTPMFWADIIFSHPDQIERIPKNSIVMDWNYESENRFERHAAKMREHGLRFYLCPGTSMWQSITGRMNNAVFNISSAAEIAHEHGAEGILLAEWGDFGHPQSPAISYMPVVFGAAFAWNCNEYKAGPRSFVIEDCKKYLDKFIYKIKGDISLANIVFRMGNYYLLENRIIGNATDLVRYMSRTNELTPEKAKVYNLVALYMQQLKEELLSVKADGICMREIMLCCDLVILIAKIHAGVKDNLNDEADRLIQEFTELWTLKFHDIGHDKFIIRLRNILNK